MGKSSCKRKNRYEFLEDAERAVEWSKTHTGAYLTIYRCGKCKAYHLAHFNKNNK